MMRFYPPKMVLLCALSLVLLPGWSWAATPTAEQALKLVPVQPGVDYDRPSPEVAARCKIIAKKIDGHVGWIVESPDGVILRKFVDTNDDGVVDQWSYYKDGLEVYRDIDSNYNGKAGPVPLVPHRRQPLGIGPERGRGDRLVEADFGRGSHRGSGGGDRHARCRPLRPPAVDARRIAVAGAGQGQSAGAWPRSSSKAMAGFKAMLAGQKALAPDATWVQFSASRPGIVPAGTDQSTKDVRVYENVTAIVESGGKHGQVQIGTLVQVGDVWRLIDAPQPMAEGQAGSRARRVLLPGLDDRPQRNGRVGGRARLRRNCWPTWRTSTARPPGQPRRRSRPDTRPAGPTCSSRSPRPPRPPTNAACGSVSLPTCSARPSSRGPTRTAPSG